MRLKREGSMQRYTQNCIGVIEECKNGSWVKYEDVEKELKEKDALIEQLRKKINNEPNDLVVDIVTGEYRI